jgi:hypothetical protein
MPDSPDQAGPAERVAGHAERPRFRISELRMGTRQRVDWHYHSRIEDTFYVLEGCVRITMTEPAEEIELQAGQSWGPVRAKRPHLGYQLRLGNRHVPRPARDRRLGLHTSRLTGPRLREE